MSDKFCFTVQLREDSKEGRFHSAIGEDYFVNYVVNNLNEIVLSMEWIVPTKNFIKAELFTADFELISSQMGIENGNKVCFKFCLNQTKQDECSVDEKAIDECNLMFVITVIPCVDMKDCANNVGDKEVLNINDEKVRDLSEDLLIGLAMDMRDLLIHGDLSDAIITNGNLVMNVHSPILSTRSPVFHNLFKDSSDEKVITIPHASAEALKDMIGFIYSGLIKFKNIDRAQELYDLAYEYELEDLHEACSVYMSNCTTDCVLQTLILAEKHRDVQLKKHAIGFILRNLGELKSSEKWECFAKDNMNLVSEICSSIRGPNEKDALYGFLSQLSAKKIKI